MRGRFDHEASPEEQIVDMGKLERIFVAVPQLKAGDLVAQEALGALGASIAKEFVAQASKLVRSANVNLDDVQRIVIGEGNHRVLATRY